MITKFDNFLNESDFKPAGMIKQPSLFTDINMCLNYIETQYEKYGTEIQIEEFLKMLKQKESSRLSDKDKMLLRNAKITFLYNHKIKTGDLLNLIF